MTSAVVVVLATVALLTQQTSRAQRFSDLPLGWENTCERTLDLVDWHPEPPSFNWSQPLVHISCRLTQGSLSLSDFRAWSNATDGRPIALDILCVNQRNSSIRFPWPFKAPHLVSLKIVNCRITDFYSAYLSDSNDVPNLRILITENVVSYMTLSHLKHRSENVPNISRHIHCASEYIEKFVWKNFTTVPVMDDPKLTGNITGILKAWIRNSHQIPYKCRYQYLRFMDESNTNSYNQAPLHLYQQRVLFAFPRLLSYILSHREYNVVPLQLTQWRLAYPKLRYLDLRWNNISTFFFIDFGDISDGVGTIDLRHNSISQLSQENIESLVHMKSAVVNLRNNPLSCNCFTNQHLFRLVRDNPRLGGVGLGGYEYIRNITCASPERLVGVPFGQLSEQDIFCEDSQTVTHIWIVPLLSCFLLLFVGVLCIAFPEKMAVVRAAVIRRVRRRSDK